MHVFRVLFAPQADQNEKSPGFGSYDKTACI